MTAIVQLRPVAVVTVHAYCALREFVGEGDWVRGVRNIEACGVSIRMRRGKYELSGTRAALRRLHDLYMECVNDPACRNGTRAAGNADLAIFEASR